MADSTTASSIAADEAAMAAATSTPAAEGTAMQTDTADMEVEETATEEVESSNSAPPQPSAEQEAEEAAQEDAADEEDTHMEEPPPKPEPISTIPSVRPSDPLTQSYTYASPVPTNAQLPPTADSALRGVPCLMGIDEAGRGPVLGPMVYGVAYAPISYASELKSIGFADSKALTADRRDSLLRGLIQNPENIGWAVRILSPQDISAGMLRRHPYNLNQQALDATVCLIQNVLDSGVDLTEIYVDTLGKAETHAKNLAYHFPRHAHIKWTVTSKADAIYPIVGAASIAAKVTRDRILENWIYREPGLGKVWMGAQEKVGRGEHVRGSAAGLLAGGEDEERRMAAGDGDDEVVGILTASAVDGEGADVSMDLDSEEISIITTTSAQVQGPSAGAGKRKRTASTKLIELAEIEADQALKRTLRKTAQLRAAVARQTAQSQKKLPKTGSSSLALQEPDGLVQSPNSAFANVGSGYPSDPNTVAFLKATLDPVFGWPGIARFSWGTIRTLLEPAKKGGASAVSRSNSAKGKGRGGKVGKGAGGRSLRSAGGEDDGGGEEGEEDVDGAAPLFLKPPKQGYSIKWADEQREAASAAVTSISKFFAPVAKSSAALAQADGGSAGAGEEGPLGRATIARLENAEVRKARTSVWKDLGIAPVGSAALQL
ncbi:hypothetical protein CF327_g1886 [Tilletia walkeri]|nr:hypothetical protein CF327_g1886 [Tilletia walkeri]